MTCLDFAVVGARVQAQAAQPTLIATLAIAEQQEQPLEGLALQCQLRIEPRRRRYAIEEERALVDLFGDPSRWAQTMQPLPWLETSVMVPAFTGRAYVELSLPCSYDVEVSAGKYFAALVEGEVALRLLFRGTIFTRGEHGLAMTPLPWDRETTWRLPVQLWREAIDARFPDAGWLRLRKDTIGALIAFKGRHALASFDGVIATLLAGAER